MPPHCDSLDGPVVTAARRTLLAGDVDLILPFVRADGEGEVRDAFDLAVKVRVLGPEAEDVADRWWIVPGQAGRKRGRCKNFCCRHLEAG